MTGIQKELDNLPDHFIVLILVDSINYVKVNLEIIKYLINKKQIPGIYITVNRPYENMVKTLEQNGIDIKKLFFIDCITPTLKGSPDRNENVLFVASPQSLTDLGIVLSEVMESVKVPDKFLFLDSLSTLTIYNSAVTVAKFSHFVVNKIRVGSFKGIFITLDKETDETLIRTLSQFCDKTIRFGGG